MNIRDRVKELRRVPASELRPSPHNWRTHPKAQLDALRGVLAEVGYAGAALARELPDGALELIDGHARAETCGDAPIPVLVLDVTEAEAKHILATFDPLGAMAEADAAKLDALLREVQTGNEAVATMLDRLAHANPVEVEAGQGGDEFDATPEDKGPTRTNLDELWVIGGKHRLLVGDCTVKENVERLMGGKKAGMVWSDPPYGYSYQSAMRTKSERFEVIANDDKILDGFIPLLGDFTEGWVLVCTSWKVIGEWLAVTTPLGDLTNLIVWDKGGGGMGDLARSLLTDFELILAYNRGSHVRGKRIGSVWGIGKDASSAYEHATQKPIALVSQALESFSDPAFIVYDPFLGSGTTMVAAHRLGRTAYGCELEPRYADVILRRCEAEGLTVARSE